MRPIRNLLLLRFTDRQSVLKRRAFWFLLCELNNKPLIFSVRVSFGIILVGAV